MLRALGCFGLGILFLAISGELRTSVLDVLEGLSHTVDAHSPLSYVVIGVGVLVGLMFCLYQAAQPRS